MASLVRTVKLKRIGKLLSMYSIIVVIIMFTVPLKVSWSKQFTIGNENVWRLLLLLYVITHSALPQMCHKHVSAW